MSDVATEVLSIIRGCKFGWGPEQPHKVKCKSQPSSVYFTASFEVVCELSLYRSLPSTSFKVAKEITIQLPCVKKPKSSDVGFNHDGSIVSTMS